jgi:hypothetical protein
MLNELLTRLKTDRFVASDHPNQADYCRGWNEHADHVVRIIGDLRLRYGLQELADAPAMDLTLKAALTGGIK